MDETLIDSIAKIEVKQDGEIISFGTAFLVTKEFVLTALHTIADRAQEPPKPYKGQIHLTFPKHSTQANIKHWDRESDWAILQCEKPPDVEPLSLAKLEQAQCTWETWGFPEMNSDGMYIDGTAKMIRGNFYDGKIKKVTSAIQLHSSMLTDEALVRGFSGAPVLVDNRVIGIIRYSLMSDHEEGKARAGTIYATCISSVVDQNKEIFPSILPKAGFSATVGMYPSGQNEGTHGKTSSKVSNESHCITYLCDRSEEIGVIKGFLENWLKSPENSKYQSPLVFLVYGSIDDCCLRFLDTVIYTMKEDYKIKIDRQRRRLSDLGNPENFISDLKNIYPKEKKIYAQSISISPRHLKNNLQECLKKLSQEQEWKKNQGILCLFVYLEYKPTIFHRIPFFPNFPRTVDSLSNTLANNYQGIFTALRLNKIERTHAVNWRECEEVIKRFPRYQDREDLAQAIESLFANNEQISMQKFTTTIRKFMSCRGNNP